MAEVMKSFPYFSVNCFLASTSSGTSPHLGEANTTLVIASLRSMGQVLGDNEETDQ